jgi:hypothetical protein
MVGVGSSAGTTQKTFARPTHNGAQKFDADCSEAGGELSDRPCLVWDEASPPDAGGSNQGVFHDSRGGARY